MTPDRKSKEGRPRNGTTFSDTDSQRVPQQHDSQSRRELLYANDFRRRVERAIFSEWYFDRSPAYVQEAALRHLNRREDDERYDGGVVA